MRDEGGVVRRRGLRPLLLPRLLQRRLRDDPGAADPRAALGRGQDDGASCSSPTARKYFISGEINSEVADQKAKMEEIEPRLLRRRDQSHLDGVSVDYDDWHFNVRPSNTEPLLRLNLESLVSPRGHGAPARRGPGAHPLVSDDAARAVGPRREQGIHRLRDPHAVRGRAGQHVPDRGRSADPRGLGAQLGQGAGRARAGAGARSATASRTSTCWSSPTSTSTTWGCWTSSPGARAPRWLRSTGSRPTSSATARTPSSTTSSPMPLMRRHGLPEDVVAAPCARCRAPSGPGGRARR